MSSSRNRILAPSEAYEAVFAMLAERGAYASARAMLVSQYCMPGHVTTMRHLAIAVYNNHDYRIANRTYGSFAGRVRRELGLARPPYEIWVLGTWPEPPIDSLGEFAFRLRPEVCAAVRRLGWADPQHAETAR